MRRKLGGERCCRHQHEQREKIDKYGTAQQHVLADPDDDRVTHLELQVAKRPNQPSLLTHPEGIHQALPAAVLRRTARAGAFAPSFDPNGAVIQRNDPPRLFDHRCACSAPARMESATRSAVPSGISPTTVTITSPSSVLMRLDTATVGPI